MPDAMTLQALEALRPGARQWAVAGMAAVLAVGLNLPTRRVRFEVEGLEEVPPPPVLYAMNHTHRLDWIAPRWLCFSRLRGRMQCNWVKPRTYEEGLARFLDLTGNVPLSSRGYLISADVRAVAGRAPTEDEYRALRDHLNDGAPLPTTELFDHIATRPRDILGVAFDPGTTTWRDAIEGLFERMMRATLAHTRRMNDQGVDLTIMPQGVTAMRLTAGHPGALQAALALDLPIVPVGLSGFPQAWGSGGSLPAHGGPVRARFGTAYRPEAIEGHTPFRPSSERAHADALTRGTRDLMDRIDALLDPEHRWAEDPDNAPTDITGVARFI